MHSRWVRITVLTGMDLLKYMNHKEESKEKLKYVENNYIVWVVKNDEQINLHQNENGKNGRTKSL